MRTFMTSILPTAFCLLNCSLYPYHHDSQQSWHALGNETPRQIQVPHFRARLLLSTDPLIALVGPANILFTLCCKHTVYNVMRSSVFATYLQECLKRSYVPFVLVRPYHLHNSVNLPRHLLHSTLHLFLIGDGLGHLYIHYTTMVITVPLAWSHLNNGISLIMSYAIVP